MSPRRYIVVSPVKNEAAFIGRTLASMVRQTLRPTLWVCVDDGSTDETARLIEEYAARHRWIRLHRLAVRPRRDYAGIIPAFYAGLRQADGTEFDFLVKLDGDLSFEGDYFERLLAKFEEDERLGIASGVCFVPTGRGPRPERHPRFFTRGVCKVYRRACWEQIGGLIPRPGWDTIDGLRANMLGWRTRSFPELALIHHRPTGTASGVLAGMKKDAQADYFAGYHPLYALLKGLRQMRRRPWVLAGAWFLVHFARCHLTRSPRIEDAPFVRYLRRQQINRLLGRRTIWQ
jgi:glycosyltransferase involved in cell wall biosynthesis